MVESTLSFRGEGPAESSQAAACGAVVAEHKGRSLQGVPWWEPRGEQALWGQTEQAGEWTRLAKGQVS